MEQLEQLFTWLGVKVASVSIDDFYLTNAGKAIHKHKVHAARLQLSMVLSCWLTGKCTSAVG